MNFQQRFLTLLIVFAAFVAAGSWVVSADEERSSSGQNTSAGETSDEEKVAESEEKKYVPKTKRELQRVLNRIQYDVTQNEATEPAFRNRYWNNKKEGVYKCIVCERPLFSSKTKYKSGTGWPSFYDPIDKKNVGLRSDFRLFYTRTEVHCSRCKAHLGHVFDDGPKPTGKRYCMNSASLKFVEAKKEEKKEE